MLDLFELQEQPYSAEDEAWDAFVAAHPHGNPLQVTQWARLKNRFNWSSHRIWMKQNGRYVAGAQMLYRNAALGLVKMGYIPRGPLVDWHDDEQIDVLINQIDQAAYQRRISIVKFEPPLWLDDFSLTRWQEICERYELRTDTDTIQPPRTVLIDLRPSEDEILAAMKSKTRYNIRYAGRKGVTVRQGAREDLGAFTKLMAVTGQRDGFGTHTPRYYLDAFDFFSPDKVALLLAEYEGELLAGVMVFAVGKTAAYLYGASSNEQRKLMPSYAAQWAAMQWAKAQGCTHYDMWGVPDAEEEELEANFTERSDGLWGVYRFKRGFGGEVCRTVGSADRVYNNLVHRLYKRYRINQ